MNNLFVFGDSYMSKHPYEWTWPNQLAKRLDCNLHNYALSGGSLPWMYHEFKNQIDNFSKGDYVVVGITNFLRKWFFHAQPIMSSLTAVEFAKEYNAKIDKNQLDAVYKFYQYLDNPEDDHDRFILFLHLLHLLTEKLKLRVLIIPCFQNEMDKYNDYRKHSFTLFNTVNGDLETIMTNEYEPSFYKSIKLIDDRKPNHLFKSNHYILTDKLIEALKSGHLDLNPDNFIQNMVNESNYSDNVFLQREARPDCPMEFIRK